MDFVAARRVVYAIVYICELVDEIGFGAAARLAVEGSED